MADLFKTSSAGMLRKMGPASTKMGRAFHLGTAAAIGTVALGVSAIKGADRWRNNIMKGLYPGSALPMESGRFGIRTNRTQAGVDGVRFNFRRR